MTKRTTSQHSPRVSSKRTRINRYVDWEQKVHSGKSVPPLPLDPSDPQSMDDFEAIETLWSLWGSLENDPVIQDELAECDALIARHHNIARPRAQDRPQSAQRRHIRSGVLAMAACLLVACVYLTVPGLFSDAPSTAQRFHTTIGEQRTVTLADQSRVTLNTNSVLSVDFTPERRTLKLLQGEAFFDVSHDPERPFEVHALDGLTRAIGTQFNVAISDAKEVDVAVLEGVVEVVSNTSSTTTSPQWPRVHVGQSVRYWQGDSIADVETAANTDVIKSWLEGKILLKDTRLEDAIEQFNRYSTKKIVIGRNNLRDIRINGLFDNHDQQAFLNGLEEIVSVKVVAQPNTLVLL